MAQRTLSDSLYRGIVEKEEEEYEDTPRLVRSFTSGIHGLTAGALNAGAAVANTVGADRVGRKLEHAADRKSATAAGIRGAVPTLEDAEGVGDYGEIAVDWLASNAPLAASTIGGGALAVGARALGGAAARKATGAAAKKLTAQQVQRAGMVGAAIPYGAATTGETASRIRHDPNATGTPAEQGRAALIGGAAQAALGLGPLGNLGRLLSKGAGVGRTLAATAAAEGVTEAGESAISRFTHKQFNPQVNMFDADARREYIESALAGAVVGGGYGAIGSGVGALLRRGKPEQPPPASTGEIQESREFGTRPPASRGQEGYKHGLEQEYRDTGPVVSVDPRQEIEAAERARGGADEERAVYMNELYDAIRDLPADGSENAAVEAGLEEMVRQQSRMQDPEYKAWAIQAINALQTQGVLPQLPSGQGPARVRLDAEDTERGLIDEGVSPQEVRNVEYLNRPDTGRPYGSKGPGVGTLEDLNAYDPANEYTSVNMLEGMREMYNASPIEGEARRTPFAQLAKVEAQKLFATGAKADGSNINTELQRKANQEARAEQQPLRDELQKVEDYLAGENPRSVGYREGVAERNKLINELRASPSAAERFLSQFHQIRKKPREGDAMPARDPLGLTFTEMQDTRPQTGAGRKGVSDPIIRFRKDARFGESKYQKNPQNRELEIDTANGPGFVDAPNLTVYMLRKLAAAGLIPEGSSKLGAAAFAFATGITSVVSNPGVLNAKGLTSLDPDLVLFQESKKDGGGKLLVRDMKTIQSRKVGALRKLKEQITRLEDAQKDAALAGSPEELEAAGARVLRIEAGLTVLYDELSAAVTEKKPADLAILKRELAAVKRRLAKVQSPNDPRDKTLRAEIARLEREIDTYRGQGEGRVQEFGESAPDTGALGRPAEWIRPRKGGSGRVNLGEGEEHMPQGEVRNRELTPEEEYERLSEEEKLRAQFRGRHGGVKRDSESGRILRVFPEEQKTEAPTEAKKVREGGKRKGDPISPEEAAELKRRAAPQGVQRLKPTAADEARLEAEAAKNRAAQQATKKPKPEPKPESKPKPEPEPEISVEARMGAQQRLKARQDEIAAVQARGQTFTQLTKLVDAVAKALKLKDISLMTVDEAFARAYSLRDNPLLTGMYQGTVRGFHHKGGIYINPELAEKSKAAAVATVMHELGHAVMKQHFNALKPKEQAAVRAEYDQWRAEQLKSATPGEALFSKMPAAQLLGYGPQSSTFESISGREKDYILSFEEWFADNVARWADTAAVPQTQVEKFFSEVAKVMDVILTAINATLKDMKLGKYQAASTVSEFMDQLTEEARTPDKNQARVERGRKLAAANRRVKPSDSLSVVVAKLGGIDSAEAEADGFDKAEFKGLGSGIYRTFNKKGDSFDGMRERLGQYDFNYDTPAELIDALMEEAAGDLQYNAQGVEIQAEKEARERFEDEEDRAAANLSAEVGEETSGAPPEPPEGSGLLGSLYNWYTAFQAGQATTLSTDMVRAVREHIEASMGTADKRVLLRAAEGTVMQRQLHELLGDNVEEILAISNDPELAAAYLYAFSRMGAIKLGPQVATVLDKFQGRMGEYYKDLYGEMGTEQQEQAVLEGIEEGQTDAEGTTDFIKLPEDVAAARRQKQARMWRDKAAVWYDKTYGRIMTTPFERLQRSKNPFLMQIARSLSVPPWESAGRGEGFLEGKIRRSSEFDRLYTRLMGDMAKDPALKDQILAAALNPDVLFKATPEVKRGVQQTRKLFKRVFQYMEEAGLTFDERENYFPNVFNQAFLGDNFEGLHTLALQEHYRSDWQKMFDDWVKKGRVVLDEESPMTVEDFIERRLKDLLRPEGIGTGETVDENHNPGFRFMNPRDLDFLMRKGSAADKKKLAAYFEQDLDTTIVQYLNSAVKRAEYARHFGMKGHKLTKMLDKAKSHGATDEELALARAYVNAATGMHGYETRQFIENIFKDTELPPVLAQFVQGREGGVINKKLRNLYGWTITYQNYRLLVASVFSSFIDPLGVGVRSGDMGIMAESLKASMKALHALVKGDKNELLDLIHTLGTIDQAMVAEDIAADYTGHQFTGAQRKANDLLFKLNGVEYLTKFTRGMATKGGEMFILKHHRKGDNKSSKEYLAELGLLPGDVKVHNDHLVFLNEEQRASATKEERARDNRLRSAVHRFVDSAIIRPDASKRPVWMSDPHFALIAHLRTFIFAFHNTIIKRVNSEAKKGEFMPMIIMGAAFMPMMLFADWLRDMLKYGVDGATWKRNWTLGDHIEYAGKRAGLLGRDELLLDVAEPLFKGDVVRSVSEALGPTATQMRQIGRDGLTERDLPGQVLYRHWD